MPSVYRFGPFALDTARRRLLRGAASVNVPPKALDVLEVLLQNRGRTVEKDDLMRRVWPDTAVEEANLTQSVFMLRRALGDEPSEPRYISTVARRGYRFVADASETAADCEPDDRRRVHRTSNLEAYHAYVRGRHYWSKRDADGLRAAIGCFRQAIDLDPTYALAYVGLAECFVILRMLGWPTPPDALATARAAAGRALEIEDTIAEAHATLAIIRLSSEWDWLGADQSFCRAIELAPDYPTTRNWYANYLAAAGRFDEAIREARQAAALDPLNVTWRMGVGHMMFLARRYHEAAAAEQSALEIEPRFALAHWVLGMTYEQTGDLSRALDAWRTADELSGGNLLLRGFLGRMLAVCGQTAAARAVLSEMKDRDARSAAPPEALALIHAGLGDTGAAFDCFERAAREGSFLLSFLNVSPVFDSLRAHPRFGSLQRLIRLA